MRTYCCYLVFPQTTGKKVAAEVKMTNQEAMINGKPLEWWRIMEYRFPLLSHLADKYLRICSQALHQGDCNT